MAEKVNRTLHYKEKATQEEEHVLFEGINIEASDKKMKKATPFAFFIKDERHKVLGGIKGNSSYGCLHIEMLWVDPAFRKKGWGLELMHAAENLGRKRKCTFASLATMDWQSLDFYKGLGYDIEHIREGFDKDSKMYIFRKDLKFEPKKKVS
ncbi:MAG TPA: GNAT family N-acetyltransferase [Rhabdochlamydiaceae bacterium]|jgi:ribosomal protein S18 acetylase RimI-like enzyme